MLIQLLDVHEKEVTEDDTGVELKVVIKLHSRKWRKWPETSQFHSAVV